MGHSERNLETRTFFCFIGQPLVNMLFCTPFSLYKMVKQEQYSQKSSTSIKVKTADYCLVFLLQGYKIQIFGHLVPPHVPVPTFFPHIHNIRPSVPSTVQSHKNQLQIQILEHAGGATPYPLGELHVLGHDGDPLGVDGAEHCVLKQDGEVGLSRLLKCQNGNSLEPTAGNLNQYLSQCLT